VEVELEEKVEAEVDIEVTDYMVEQLNNAEGATNEALNVFQELYSERNEIYLENMEIHGSVTVEQVSDVLELDLSTIFGPIRQVLVDSILIMVSEIGSMIISWLPYMLPVVGIYIAINVSLVFIKGSVLGFGATADVKADDGIPEAPAEWIYLQNQKGA
jgi:hypothetical protein